MLRFHPDHPMPELVDVSASQTSLFGHSFGIPFTDLLGILQPRQLSWPEFLPAYSPALANLRPSPLSTDFLIANLCLLHSPLHRIALYTPPALKCCPYCYHL